MRVSEPTTDYTDYNYNQTEFICEIECEKSKCTYLGKQVHLKC